MSSRIEWVVTPEQAWMENYQRWALGLADRIEAYLNSRREEIENWMKANHPWQNRTFIAEEGLFAQVLRDGAFIILTIGHDAITYYSRFLERFMSPVAPGISKWSVLAPALDYWGPIIVADLRKMLGS